MTIDDTYSKHLKKVIPPFREGLKATPVHRVVASGENSDLCFLLRGEENKDPEYWYVTEEGLKAVFGLTGMIQSVEILNENNLDAVLSRSNAYGNFNEGKKGALPLKDIAPIIDGIYQGIRLLTFRKESEKRKFEWDAARLFLRFEEYNKLFDCTDIIPEYTDLMTPIKVSTGCNGSCIYCSEPSKNPFVPYSGEKIREEITRALELQQKYHAGQEALMNEGFINTTDLLKFPLKGGVDPLEIIGLFKESFPYLQKVYSFMSVPSVLETDQHYLERLFNNAEGINRALIGIETADMATSNFLGKREGYNQKREALFKLKRAGFKVKPIVQVGMVGEGFTRNGTFISSRQGLEATARLIGDFLSYTKLSKKPDKVHISVYTPIDGTRLKRLHDEGKIIKPYSSPAGLEEDIMFFIDQLGKNGAATYSQVEFGYESALEGRISLGK